MTVPSLFIDGAWTTGSSGETSPVIDPFDGREIERELGPTGLDEYREATHIYQDIAPAPSGWFRA
jgi:hypothetical protein